MLSCPESRNEPSASRPPLEARLDGEHLVAIDTVHDRIAGSCRLLSPAAAARAGGYAMQRRFDLDWLQPLHGRVVEAGEAFIDPHYRAGVVFRLLAERLARYLIDNALDHVIATAGVDAADGGHTAASIYRAALGRAAAPPGLQVFPRAGLPLERLCGALDVQAPPPLRAWLALGAWVCGEPAWDRDGLRADIPLLLPLARMQGAEARRFLRRAA